jgi:hypothetical protein
MLAVLLITSCCQPFTYLLCWVYRIIIDIGKQLGRKLLSGNLNLINITLPVSCQPKHLHNAPAVLRPAVDELQTGPAGHIPAAECGNAANAQCLHASASWCSQLS